MPILRLLANYVKNYRTGKMALYIFSTMILFWAVYEGIISYMTPLIISENGISESMMGIIIGTSSIAGALFDFLACQIFKNTYYKRIFLIMFAICLIYPLILSQANSFMVYLLAMATWGVYFDLRNIGNFDFVGRHTSKSEHVSSFGVIQIFQSIGFLIAPILVGLLIADSFNYKPLIMAWIFLTISVLFFVILYSIKDKHLPEPETKYHERKKTWRGLLLNWEDIGRILFPVLILTMMLNFIDAFFWTIGPIFAESLTELKSFSGFFMTAYSLPSLLVGWLIGSLAKKYGKKRTAFVALFMGAIFLSMTYFIDNGILLIINIFAASFFISMSWPSINGAYADYISETPHYEKEITGLEDFFTNLGYVLGPITAGYIADYVGNRGAFSLLGISAIIIAIILIIVTPKKINVNKRLEEARS
jgi:MFS family permease